MASSNPNRHWPSMFKSKPACNSLHHHHQWNNKHNDSNNMTSSFIRTSYTSGGDQEERSAEPKPRWNPKPEQIRILEAIFNSGMVNPPRDEIRKIRAQLQEYGQVGDANVFYWFQNRKSRSKHKRSLNNNNNNNNNNSSPKEIITPPPPPQHNNNNNKALVSNNIVAPISTNPPPPAQAQAQAFFYIPVQQNGGGGGEANKSAVSVPTTQGFYFSTTELSGVVQLPEGPRGQHQQINIVGSCGTNNNNGVLLNELMTPSPSNNNMDGHDKAMQMQHITTTVPPTSRTATFTLPSPISHLNPGAAEEEGRMKSTVFINDVAFEVEVGPLNLREAFGDDAVLIHVVSGQPVLVDQWGVTLHPLQHGASYYLI